MKRRVFSLAGLAALWLGVGLAQAVTTHLVLNSTYVPPPPDRGWVRVSPSVWKHSLDDAFTSVGLLKFQVDAIPQGAVIQSAKLCYYVQKSEAFNPHVIYVRRMPDDSWSYLNNGPDELRDWAWDVEMAQYYTGYIGWREIDVTSRLQEEVNAGDDLFSVKFNQDDEGQIFERIASPDAWYSPHRPKLDVVFDHPQTINPDLTLSRHDIAFGSMWPVPYDPVTITATVHNVGGTATSTSFPVRFLDNGVPIGNDVWITNPIPGGGGWVTAQITWYPTEGEHPIEVIADPGNPGQIIEINEYNNSNADLSNDGEPYKYEVRGQYKYYVESFESDFGRWRKDADESWNEVNGHQDWDVERKTDAGQAYDGYTYLKMWLDPLYDNGTVWIERPIPIAPDVSFLELSYFGQRGDPFHPFSYIGTFDPDLTEDLTLAPHLLSQSWRRHRSLSFYEPNPQPELWFGAGFRIAYTQSMGNELFDLYTVRVNPPRSSMDLAMAYNNGTKLVWDGLSTHHLIYVSGDSILYSRSEDPAGNTWSDAEFVGFVVPGQYPAIALAPDGYPRAVWSNGLNLYYSKRSDTGWQSPPQEWLFL